MKIERTEKQIQVTSPYHPSLPAKAKKLGGKWDGSCWVFDIRDEDRVKDLYLKVYGEWENAVEAVTVKITAKDRISEWNAGIFFGPRQIARATGRDSGAKLGDGVICLQGKATSGGSVKNWTTVINEGSVFEIKDFPKALLDNDNASWDVEMIDINKPDTAALEAEKAALLLRLAEIDNILKEA